MPAHPPRLRFLLLPLGALAAFLGYTGPWVDHPAAGLVIAGLDLAEVVKFLTPVQSGALRLWREGFYLPLVAISLTLSLYAFRPAARSPRPVRLALLAGAAVAALNLLPPAWSPALLRAPEFRLQSGVLLLLLAAAACSPLLALLPEWSVRAAVSLLCLAALLLPTLQFVRILPALSDLYAQALAPGWGLWVTLAGLATVGIAGGLLRTAETGSDAA